MTHKIEQHDSYGIMQISRMSGTRSNFFGSSLEEHQNYLMIRVNQAERIIDEHGRDRIGALRGERIVEVMMTQTQFAELITSMNVSEGVPCTITVKNNKHVERPPSVKREVSNVKEFFQKKLWVFTDTILKKAEEIGPILEKKTPLTVQDKNQIAFVINSVSTELRSNVPFILDMFHEATEKVTVAAKAEIDAFVTHNIVHAGLKALGINVSKQEQDLSGGSLLPDGTISEDCEG
jgi:hypothetical protein